MIPLQQVATQASETSEKASDRGPGTREFSEDKALDEIAKRTHVDRDRLTAGSQRCEKFWHEDDNGGQAVLISGWQITVWVRPATPGDYYVLFIDDDGDVREFHGGA